MLSNKLNPVASAKLNFPGFQEILDFTSAGSESSVSVAVDGDTDKEYKIVVRQLSSSVSVYLRLNNDSGTNYGLQYLLNSNGSIQAGRVASAQFTVGIDNYSLTTNTLLTPTGLIKTMEGMIQRWTSGTTVYQTYNSGLSYNSTSNITSLNFSSASGNFTAGTRITVYVRRSNV